MSKKSRSIQERIGKRIVGKRFKSKYKHERIDGNEVGKIVKAKEYKPY